MLLLMVVWAEVMLITGNLELKNAETNVIPKEELWTELPPHVKCRIHVPVWTQNILPANDERRLQIF